ncbi:hypothetical protein ACFL20_00070 [Spirochaetota bacterium]
MNPISRILSKFFSTLNRLINDLDLRSVRIIQQTFIFIIIVLCIVGIFVGYNMGSKSAKVKKGPPLAPNTRDIFEIIINREKESGKFAPMLESKLITESRYSKEKKIMFKSQEKLTPDLDESIVDTHKNKKSKTSTQMKMQNEIFEGEYMRRMKRKTDVKPLKKKEDMPDSKKENRVINDKGSILPLKKGTEKERKIKLKDPVIIKKNTGIIDK